MVFKVFTKQRIAIFCGLIGFFIFIALFAPIRLAEGHYAHQIIRVIKIPIPISTSMSTPISTPVPAITTPPTLTLSQPGNDNAPIGHPGTRVDITGQGFTVNSSLSLYTTIDPNQCRAGGRLLQFSSQPVESVQADGTFTLHTIWPNNAGQPGTAYYICAISSTTAGEDVTSGQTFSVAQRVTVSVSTSSVNPGDSITITGENWLPPLALQVSIVASQGGGSAIASATTIPDTNGHFSVNLTIGSDVQPGQYMISVVAPNEPTLTNRANAPSVITINAQATPTPIATPTSAVVQAPASVDTTAGSSSNSGSGVTVFAFFLGGLGLLCVIVGGVMFAIAGSSPSRMP